MGLREQVRKADAWVRNAPVIVVLLLLALLLSAVFTVTDGVSRAIQYWETEVQWRDREYEKLMSLQAGMSVSRVQAVLGEPVFIRASSDRSLVERSYRGRDYWVQAISDEIGTVQVIAFTSCDDRFRPTFVTPTGQRVTLHETTLAEFGDPRAEDQWYSPRLATANAYFFDIYGGGNPTRYQRYGIGLNDACPWVDEIYVIDLYLSVIFDSGNLETFRQKARINTYVVSGVSREITEPRSGFSVGVDRILTRTLSDNE